MSVSQLRHCVTDLMSLYTAILVSVYFSTHSMYITVNDQSTFSVVHRESADIYTQCISMSDESNEDTSVLYLV